MLCDKCTSIHFKHIGDCAPIQREPARVVSADIDISGSVYYFHHDSKDALQASAEGGCHFCEMLFRYLFEMPSEGINYDRSFAKGAVILRRSVVEKWLKKDNGIHEWNANDWIYITCEDRKLITTSRQGYEGINPCSEPCFDHQAVDRIL